MKLLFTYFFLILSLFPLAQTNSKHVHVRGYYRSDGTYVQPHYRTAPNNTNIDNFSTQGNVNPYTGQSGYIPPDNKVKTIYKQKKSNTIRSTCVKSKETPKKIPKKTYNIISTDIQKYYSSSRIYTTTGSYGQLWAGPAQKDVIHALKKGTKVNVLSYENGFYKVISNGIIGYILYITINETFEMRSLRGFSSKSLEKSSKSLRNTVDNDYAEIDKSKVEILSEKYVSVSKANLRFGPTTGSKILTTIEMNYPIGIIDESTYNNWTKVIIVRDTEHFIGFLSNLLISSNKVQSNLSKNRVSIDLLKPKQVVNKFLISLGEKDFRRAYSLSNNPDWNYSGGYKWFSSSNAYGGVDYIFINKLRLENITNNQAIVFADYYASDPLHISRRWKQLFFLESQNGNWRIIKTKLVN